MFLYLFFILIVNGKLNWIEMTNHAEWSARSAFTAVMYNNSIVIEGDGYPNIASVWGSSKNTSIWTEYTQNIGISGRTGMASVVLNNQIISTGGCNQSDTRYNDVWSSSDGGYQWKQITKSSGWSTRCCHASVSYNQSIYILGGHDMNNYRNDVWKSNDYGLTWIMITNNASWTPRDALGAVILNNKIFIMGGHDASNGNKQWHNDIWSSSDGGYTWIMITNNAEWSGRNAFGLVVWNYNNINNMVIMGGGQLNDTQYVIFDDVWISNNEGLSWKQLNTSSIWSARCWFPAITLNNNIYVLGGTTVKNTAQNDIWVLKDE